MRPMKAKGLVAGALFVALIAAQNERSARAVPIEVGVMGGYHLFSKDLELGVLDEDGVGQPKSFVGFGARIAVGLFSRLMIEVEGRFFPTKSADAGTSSRGASVVGYNAQLLFDLTKGKIRPFVLAGGGFHTIFPSDSLKNAANPIDAIKGDTDESFHYGVGLKLFVTKSIAVRLDLRHYLPPSSTDESFTNDFEGLLGISLRFGDKKEPAVVVVQPEPEPEPEPVDTDGDGIYDDKDTCPKDAEDKDGFEDTDGCPDIDNDKDGMKDPEDKCPNEAETVNGVDDEDGCPEVDNDNDGLVGSADKCPDVAEDKDGFQDDDGCDDPDNDGDGVMDALDQCPTEMETKNGYKDEDGCKDEVPKALKKFTGVIKGINFKVGSDLIAKGSFPLLDRAAKVLTDFPDVKVEISGHTDSDGSRDMNLDLSARRAESVKNYMVGKGIAAERIFSVGYGPDKPIADNTKKKGKALNRRTEFRLMQPGETAPVAPTPDGSAPPPPPAPTP
jgi:outer membrane protein OmpA-like peptidoglycan-associated protein